MFNKSFVTSLSKLSALLTISALAINTPIFLNAASALPKQGTDTEGGGGRDEPKPNPAPKPKPGSSQPKNYPAAVKYLLANSSSLQQIATTAWDSGAKDITKEKIRKALDGKKIREGVSTYDVNLGLSGVSQTQVSPGSNSNQINVKLIIPGNNSELKTTTPTIIGSYGDPSFRIMFDLEVDLKLSTLIDKINVDDVSIKISNAKMNGSNAVGTLVETLGDLFTNGGFSQRVVSSINGDYSAKDNLASYIRSAVNRYIPANVLSPNNSMTIKMIRDVMMNSEIVTPFKMK